MASLSSDLFASSFIKEKVHSSQSYAQNLYAALCNNEFVKEQGKPWGCSWRTSGDIVSNILGQGDYLDWYCSGMMLAPDEEYLQQKNFVCEGAITEEIEQDLLSLGWRKL